MTAFSCSGEIVKVRDQEMRSHEIELDSVLWCEIARLAQAEAVTPAAIISTALAVVMQRVTEGDAALRAVLHLAPTGSGSQRRGQPIPAVDAAASFIAAIRSSDRGRQVFASPDDASNPKWDLSVTMVPPEGAAPGLLCLLADPASMTAPRACSLLDACRHILQAALGDPRRPITELPVAPRHDRALEWAKQPPDPASALADHPQDMAGLFAAICRRWPGEKAIVWPGGELSFGQVEASAADLAALLRNHGAGPGDIIAFRTTMQAPPHGTALYLVAQAASLQLGCAILPLGQQLPAAQASAQIASLRVRLVLSAIPELDCSPEWAPHGRRIPIERFSGAFLLVNTMAAPEAGPEPDTAVLFTTSGTTGTPKTIRVSQSMMLGLVSGLLVSGMFPPLPGLLCPNIGFDLAISDVWLPWTKGRHVVLLAVERRSPPVLAAANELGALVLSLSPTMATVALLEDPDCFARYHTLILAGEAVPLALARRLAALAPHLNVINGYGPTENTVLSTFAALDDPAEPSVPIGRAVPEYRVLIGDTALRALPAHWPGELLIASAAPARGYRDRVLTAERFVELPGERPGPFFRTGDFGWVDEHGRVQFMGRRDRQVKLGGVRVEIDGIEHRIAEVPGVADVGVVEFDGAERTQLVAVIQLRPGISDLSALSANILAECRAWLSRAAAVSELVFVDAMPVGPSGKKSHAALRAMLRDRAGPGRAGTLLQSRSLPAPGSIEERLASLWTDLLGGPQLRFIEDDVFALGASSLDALRMADRIEQAFDVRIAEDMMFACTTIGAQAAMIRLAPRRVDAPSSGLRMVRPGHKPVPLGALLGMPLIGGETHYLGSIALNALPGYDLWSYAIKPAGGSMLEGTACFDCARQIADRLLAADAPRFSAFIGFSVGGFIAWLVDRQLVAAGRPPTPVINLEGGALHRYFPEWRDRTLPFLPKRKTPARMLLLHRTRAGGSVICDPLPAAWAEAEDSESLALQVLPCRTVSHLDFLRPALFAAHARGLNAFVESGTLEGIGDADAVEIGTHGGALFRMLENPSSAGGDKIRSFVASLPSEPIEVDLRLPLLFLALACGDRELAVGICDRLAAEAPNLRDAVYAKVALLAERGEQVAAAGLAERWCREDTALRDRARCTTSPPIEQDLTANFARSPWQAMDLAALRGLRR